MKVSYKKLWKLLVDKEMSKADFRERCGFSTGTLTKLNKSKPVTMETLLRIFETFGCNIGDICDAEEGDGICKTT